MLLKVDWECIGSNTQAELFEKCQEGFVTCSIPLKVAGSKKYTLAQCLIHISSSVTDGAKESEDDSVSTRNPNTIDEGNQEFQQLIEDKRPEQPAEEEEEEERAVSVPPEHEEANFSDNGEAEEGYNSERGSLLEDPSFGSVDSGESASEHVAEGNHLELAYFVLLLLKMCMV